MGWLIDKSANSNYVAVHSRAWFNAVQHVLSPYRTWVSTSQGAKKKKKKEEEEEEGGGCVVYMCDKMQNGGFDKGDSNNNSTRSRGMHYLVCIKRI